jgi:hypothetical protein
MESRYLFSAMAGVFCVFLIVATVTTYRYIEHRHTPTVFQKR